MLALPAWFCIIVAVVALIRSLLIAFAVIVATLSNDRSRVKRAERIVRILGQRWRGERSD